MNLERYRDQLRRYLGERAEGRYSYLSGRAPGLDLAAVYETYAADLFSDERVLELRGLHGAAPPGERRPLGWLLRFAVDHNLEQRVRSIDRELAAGARAPGDGGGGAAELQIKLQGTADRAERQALWEQLRDRTKAQNDLRRARLRAWGEGARELTGSGYVALYESLTGVQSGLLREQLQRFLAASRDYYGAHLARFAEVALGLKAAELRPWDVSRLLRGAPWDSQFPEGRALSLLKRTLMGLGIDLKKVSNLVIDDDERPGKVVGARCIRVDVPGRVYLVLRPQGGLVDVLALFNEAGQALQAAHVAPGEPVESRFLGDRAVSRTFGSLLQYLVLSHEWLEDFVKLGCTEEFRSFLRFRKLYVLRAHAVRFLVELELHGEGLAEDDLPRRASELWEKELRVPGDADFAWLGLEEPFLSTEYLRGWIFEAELREILGQRFGSRWYSRPAAGDFLRELWSLGQRYTVEELGSRVRALTLDLGPLTRELA